MKQSLKQQAVKGSKHCSYNLGKVLDFSSRLEKSLISVKVVEKYLISLLGLEEVLEIHYLVYAIQPFSSKLDYFAEENLRVILSVRTYKGHVLEQSVISLFI